MGREILLVDTVRYLGVFIVSSSRFCCSFDNAKKSFYRAFNAVFRKVGRVASQNVVIKLLSPNAFLCYITALNVAQSPKVSSTR